MIMVTVLPLKENGSAARASRPAINKPKASRRTRPVRRPIIPSLPDFLRPVGWRRFFIWRNQFRLLAASQNLLGLSRAGPPGLGAAFEPSQKAKPKGRRWQRQKPLKAF